MSSARVSGKRCNTNILGEEKIFFAAKKSAGCEEIRLLFEFVPIFSPQISMRLDTTDLNILRHLQQEGRISNLKLAEAVFLSPSACLRRVHLLEEAGIIKGYMARLDAELLGLDVEAFVMITMRREVDQWHEQFVTALAGWEEVVASFVVTGEANYMLRVRARNLKHYSDFVMDRLYKVPGVLDIRSHMVLRNLGESNVLGTGLLQVNA